MCTGKSLSEALIFASTNPQYDDRLFIELQVQYMKLPSSNLGRTCCVQKLFLTFRTIFVHNMFSPYSAKIRASDKDLPVTADPSLLCAHRFRPKPTQTIFCLHLFPLGPELNYLVQKVSCHILFQKTDRLYDVQMSVILDFKLQKVTYIHTMCLNILLQFKQIKDKNTS